MCHTCINIHVYMHVCYATYMYVQYACIFIMSLFSLPQDWNSIQGKGCFYLLPSSSDDDDGSLLIQSHQYALTLSSPSHIWVEMSPSPPGTGLEQSLSLPFLSPLSLCSGDPLTDTGLYIFHMNKQEEPTELITFTQHFINGSVRGVVENLLSTYSCQKEPDVS